MFSFLRRTKPRCAPRHPGYQPLVEALEERRLLADLRALIVDNPDPVIAGRNVTYRVTVANNTGTPGDAANIELTNGIPENMTFAALTVVPAEWTCETPAVGQRGSIVCRRSALPFGQHSTLSWVLRVDADAPQRFDSFVSNIVTVRSTTPDSNPDNNRTTAETRVQGQADLEVITQDVIDPIQAGHNQTYRITIANKGPSDAAKVFLADPVPADMTFVAITVTPAGWHCTTPQVGGIGTIRCSKNSLAAGTWDTFGVVMKAKSNTDSQDIMNTAAAVSATTNATSGEAGSATTHVQGTPTSQAAADFSLQITRIPDLVFPGELVDYTITVTNAGPSAAIPRAVFAIPENTSFPGFITAQNWDCQVTARDVVCVRTSPLASGESDDIRVSVRVPDTVPPGTQISGAATVSSGVTDPSTSPSNNGDADTFRVALPD